VIRLTSLRSKIFLFVVVILLPGATLVMTLTQQDVTRTVTVAEQRAIDNVLNLLADDSTARWRSLLSEKAKTARQARQPLLEFNTLIQTLLTEFNTSNASTTRQQALDWLGTIDLGNQRQVLVLDDALTVLQDNQGQYMGQNLAQETDLKGRSLARIVEEEITTGAHSFVIYRTTDANHKEELRYAVLARFAPWNWFILIGDSAQFILDEFDEQRHRMERALSDTIKGIQLAGSGFVFILDNHGELITPLSAAQQQLLRTPINDDATTPLADVLLQMQQHQQDTYFVEPPQGRRKQSLVWQVKAHYIKPLKWTIAAAVPTQEVVQPAVRLRNRIGLLFLLGLLAALGIAWLLSSRLTRPLQALSNVARTLPQQDLTEKTALPPEINTLPQRYHDEVGQLATAFIFMENQLREKIVRLLQETAHRERFEGELSIAREIQLGLLPEHLPQAAQPRIDLHATMIPAKTVGGDLYDYFMLPNGKLCFAIGDVSDKGMPAALFMAVTRTLLRAFAEEETNPAYLMEKINSQLSDNNPNLMFVTLMIATLDLDNYALQWANAGHPPPIIRQANGEVKALGGRSGPACGVQGELSYTLFTQTLAPGEILINYTDGISEAMNAHNEPYEDERLYRLLRQPSMASPAAVNIVKTLLQDVARHTGDQEAWDDITLLVIQRRPT